VEDYFEIEKFETPYGPVERIRTVACHATTIHVVWSCESTDDWPDRIDYIAY